MPLSQELLFNKSLFQRMLEGQGGACVLNQQVRMSPIVLNVVQDIVKSENMIHGKSIRLSDLREPEPDLKMLKKLCP
jgi:hypothetical protein